MADSDVPSLEVSFAIDTAGSFGELERLQAIMNSSEATALKAAASVERQFNSLNLGGATAQVQGFGNVVTREMARAEKAGEGLIRQLQRQTEQYGKTAAEIRNMRVDKLTADLERLGNVDAAGRLRVLNAEMTLLESGAGRAAGATGGTRAAMQGLSFQAQDAFTQISMGTNVLSVLAIQGGQAAGQMANMGGRMGAVASFLIGPWGLAITGALLVLGSLTKGLFDNEEASKAAADGLKKFQDRQSDIGNFIDSTTGKLIEQNRELVINAVLTRQKQIADNDAAVGDSRRAAFEAARKASIQYKADPSVEGGMSVGIDRGVQYVIDRAGGDVGRLTRGLAELAKQRPELAKTALAISGIGGQAILAQRENGRLGKELRALNGDTKALASGTTALIDRQVALTTATTPLARARAELALVQQTSTAADKAGGAALAKYRADLTAATLAVNAAEAAQKAQTSATRAGTKEANAAAAAARREASHAEQLAREGAAIEAQIGNLYGLADAYSASGSAALIAEARVKAESQAIRKRGDVDEFVNQQIRLAIAQRVKDAEQTAAAVREQARVQTEVNAAVAAGEVPAARANELVRERIAELPLLAAIEAAQQRGLAAAAQQATEALEAQRKAVADAKAAATGQFFTGAAQDDARRLALLVEENRLVGASTVERAKAIAIIRATQELEANGFALGTTYANKFVADQVRIAEQTEMNAAATRDWNEALDFTADKWDLIAKNVQDGARGMADAFGQIGRAIGDVASIYGDYRANQERGDAAHLKALKEAQSPAAKERENAKYALATSTAQIGMFGDMASAAKGFFKEKSAGYRAIMAAEKVFRAFEFAMSVRSMIQDASETISSVVNSGARATAAGAEGVAKQAKLPFPFNIAAMAATAAALVAAGIAVLGSGGGSGAAPVKTAEDYQNAQGTGSVLGDASAKSDSINKSLELMMRNSSKDLEYSNEMVRALRAIESNLGNLAAAVGRELNVGGGLDASKLGLGTNTSGGLAGIGGLFSKSVTKELNDAGIQFDGTTVASAIAGNITASLYQEILQTTSKSGFLGIGGSTKTKLVTSNTGADAALTDEVALLLNSMRTAIVGAAGTIGVDGAAALLDAFEINIGRVSLKGLTSEEIESELVAVFSRVGDDMAGAVGAGLTEFQHAGEGMLETLMRLAKEYSVVDVTLRSVGMTFGAVGLASVGARTALIELFGGLDAFTEQTSFFRENFLSEAEQMAPIIAAVNAEMARLGQTGVDTKDEFKNLVLGLDLSTDAGQQMYAALIAVAPAFAKATEYTASLNGELVETAKTAEQLAAIERQRRGLDIQLMEAQGNIAGALAAKRADELAAIDETLRALQQQVWTAQDAAQATRDLAAANEEAARAAAALATQRRSLEIELMDATGNAAGALTARRMDELAALDASLRPLKEQIWAAQEAAAAQADLVAAQAEAARVAGEIAEQLARDAETAAAAAQALAAQRRSLEIQLMEAIGDTAGAVAAKRSDELGAMDASLRALQQQVWAAQDATAANTALAAAQETAAQAARAEADATAALARQRAALEIAIMRATGREAEAVSAERALELSALDASLRGLQQQLWAAQDATAAAEAAGRAQADYLAAAKQAADDAEQLRRTRVGMQADLLGLLGNAAGATALRRQEELAALDASLRPLQLSIYAQQDLAAAAEMAADRVSTARDRLSTSYERESSALQETIDRFAGFGESLRKFRASLGAGDTAAGDAYRLAQGRFVDASSLAAMGDAGALAELEGISQDFLAASRDRASSLLEYQRDVGRVASSVERAIGASDEAVDYAQLQLEALKSSVAGLIDINESVISVHDAILLLQAELAGGTTPPAAQIPATAYTPTAQPMSVDTAELERRIDDLAARLSVQNTAIAESTGKMSRTMDRWDGGGLLVRTDEDSPLAVDVVE